MADSTPRALEHPRLDDINESRVNLIIGLSTTLLVLSSSAVTFRFLARWMRRVPWHADDSLIIPSLIFVIVLCLGNIISTSFGNGTHAITRANLDVINSLMIDYLLAIVYILAIFFLKMAILELYRRALPSHNRWFNLSLSFMRVAVALWSLAAIIVTIFSCWPISKFWHRFDLGGQGRCGDLLTIQLSFSVINSAVDIFLLILPVTMLHTLQTTNRRTFELSGIFFLGICACAASIFRVNAIYVAYPRLEIEQDPTYGVTSLLLTSALEPTLGVICACLPAIYPFLTSYRSLFRLQGQHSPPSTPSSKFKPLLLSTTSSSTNSGNESEHTTKPTTSRLHPPQKPITKKSVPTANIPVTKFFRSPSPVPLLPLSRKTSAILHQNANINPSPLGSHAPKEPESVHHTSHIRTRALTPTHTGARRSASRTRELLRPSLEEPNPSRPSGLTNEIRRGSTGPAGSVVGVDDEGGEIRGGIAVKRSVEWRESLAEGLVKGNRGEKETKVGMRMGMGPFGGWEDVAIAR